MRNGRYQIPPLRPELEAAHDAMGATQDYFAYAVCRTYDGQSWEVNIRQGNIYSVLETCYADYDEALAAGAAWLREESQRKLSPAEEDHLALWEEGFNS